MTYTRTTLSLTDELIDLADAQAIREGKASRSAHIGDLIKENEQRWIINRLKAKGYTVETLAFGLTVINKGEIVFHGVEAEVTKWLDEVEG